MAYIHIDNQNRKFKLYGIYRTWYSAFCKGKASGRRWFIRKLPSGQCALYLHQFRQ